MKLLIVGIVIGLITAAVCFYGGMTFANKTESEMQFLHNEHGIIATRIDLMDKTMNVKLDAIQKGIDCLLNIARSSRSDFN